MCRGGPVNGWERVLCWDTILHPASGVAITTVTVLGRWTWKCVRPLREGER